MAEREEDPDLFHDLNMCLEKNRLASFSDWVFDQIEPAAQCTSVAMASAGWYRPNQLKEPDLARCFVCYKELDGWESTDDPLKEHKSHSKKCAFLKLRNRQNLTVREFLDLYKVSQVNKIEMQNAQAIEDFKARAAQVRSEMQKIVEK